MEERNVRRFCYRLFAVLLIVPLTGCLGTSVQSPRTGGALRGSTDARIVAAPVVVRASDCTRGLAQVQTYVPLWGVAVGILTIGIIVPITTTYSCVEG